MRNGAYYWVYFGGWFVAFLLKPVFNLLSCYFWNHIFNAFRIGILLRQFHYQASNCNAT
jgi:hypothetical protein